MACMLRRFWRRLEAERKRSCDTSLVSRSYIYQDSARALTKVSVNSQLRVRVSHDCPMKCLKY